MKLLFSSHFIAVLTGNRLHTPHATRKKCHTACKQRREQHGYFWCLPLLWHTAKRMTQQKHYVRWEVFKHDLEAQHREVGALSKQHVALALYTDYLIWSSAFLHWQLTGSNWVIPRQHSFLSSNTALFQACFLVSPLFPCQFLLHHRNNFLILIPTYWVSTSVVSKVGCT